MAQTSGSHRPGNRRSGGGNHPQATPQNQMNQSPNAAHSNGYYNYGYTQPAQSNGQATQRGYLTPAQKKARLRRKQELLKRRRRHRRLLFALAFLLVVAVAFS